MRLLMSLIFLNILNLKLAFGVSTIKPTALPSRQPSDQCTNIIFFESPLPISSTGHVLDYCYTFTFSYGVESVEACGFDFATISPGVYATQGTPAILWYKRGGMGENGVGLQRNSNREIPIDGMVQLSTTDLVNANSPQFNIGSTSGNEKFCVYGSDVKGQLGTTLLYESFEERVYFYFPDTYRQFQYISFTSCISNLYTTSTGGPAKPSADILLQYITKLDYTSCTSAPTVKPTAVPTERPTNRPSGPTQTPVYQPPISPTARPTTCYPTMMPTAPTVTPSAKPTTSRPTFMPSNVPSAVPSFEPSFTPSYTPSVMPSSIPTVVPTAKPSVTPTAVPSVQPTTRNPTFTPTVTPTTSKPSVMPTVKPTVTPTTTKPTSQPTTGSPFISYRPTHPTYTPTYTPISEPSVEPSQPPSSTPTDEPSYSPTVTPTSVPSAEPSEMPTDVPSVDPTYAPSGTPLVNPTSAPSADPTYVPSASPTVLPTYKPSYVPSSRPSYSHTPTRLPTYAPTELAGSPTDSPVFAPTKRPTLVPSMQPSTPTAAPQYEPTLLPTDAPVYQPTVLPTSEPTEMPSAIPTEAPTDEPTAEPSKQPSKAPSKRPSRLPTPSPTVEPTTLGKGLVDKCSYDINGYFVNSSLYSAFFIVHHVLVNTSTSEFMVTGANESYAETVRCVLAGNYSIESVKVNITDVLIPQTKSPSAAPIVALTASSANRRSLAADESRLVDVRYIIEYKFPVPRDTSVSGAYDDVQVYFDGLTQKLTASMKNEYFTAVLRQYASESNINSFADSKTVTTPEIFGPYLKTNLPTSAPNASVKSASNGAALASVWSKLAVILGTISGLLCILFGISMLYYYYIQRKRAREEDMAKWAVEASDADITVHKKYKNGHDEMEGMNPAFKKRVVDNNTAANRVSTVIQNVVRRLSTYVIGNSNTNNTNHEATAATGAVHGSNNGASSRAASPMRSNHDVNTMSPAFIPPLDSVRIESARGSSGNSGGSFDEGGVFQDDAYNGVASNESSMKSSSAFFGSNNNINNKNKKNMYNNDDAFSNEE